MYQISTIAPLEALKKSIQSEKEMKAYYQKAVKYITDDNAQAILKALGEHAIAHQESSTVMYSKFSGRKILYLNLDRRHRLTTLLSCTSDPEDIIRTAKRNEKELEKFYTVASRRFLDPDLRAYFRRLAKDNQQHVALLEATFVEPIPDDEPEESLDVVENESLVY